MSRLVNFFIQLPVNMRMLHWSNMLTSSGSADTKCYIEVSHLCDAFLETYIKRYGKPKLSCGNNCIIKLTPMSETRVVHYYNKAIQFLENDIVKHIETNNDADLVAICCQIIARIKMLLITCELKHASLDDDAD